MDNGTKRNCANVAAVAGVLLISALALREWGGLPGGVSSSPIKAISSPANSVAVGPPSTRPLNKREQVWQRRETPVVMPADLLATIAAKDPKLSDWIGAWQKDHFGVGTQSEVLLAPLLKETPLGAGDLWRLCRQIDRGGVSMPCRYIAAEAVRHAKEEVAEKSVRVNSAYVDELYKLLPFLQYGAYADPQALEIWSQLILDAPRNATNQELLDAARLGVALATLAEGDVDQASRMLGQFSNQAASLSHPRQLSLANQNELNFLLGNVAMKQDRYTEALSYYEAVPQIDSDTAIDSMLYSTDALAHLGRRDEAEQRLAEFIVRYHLDEDAPGHYTERIGNQMLARIVRIAAAEGGKNDFGP